MKHHTEGDNADVKENVSYDEVAMREERYKQKCDEQRDCDRQ